MLTEYGGTCHHLHYQKVMKMFQMFDSYIKSNIFAGGHELGLELDLIYRGGLKALRY
ncbi:unnamed protein product [Musa textilis]